MKKKLCFTVQRYGAEINGGAEAYTKIYAEKLAGDYDITVLTTCALDYQKWENYYSEGESDEGGVHIVRFRVQRERSADFPVLTANIYGREHTQDEAYAWIDAQGPFCPEIPEYIEKKKDKFDLFLFFTYLYYPTVRGISAAGKKAVLVPFCHDEPPVYLKCFDNVFHAPAGIIFNTPEEKSFVYKRFGITDALPSITTGIGLDTPDPKELPDGRERFGLKKPYLLYMGRIDESKGCHEMFEWFTEYKKDNHDDLQLVLMGKEVMKIPKSKDIVSLGFVSEEEKYAVLKSCDALILPSHFESLSIVVLEAFKFRKPVLVSGFCEVLNGHCRRSNAGLYFCGRYELEECIHLIEDNPHLREAMGRNGEKYVEENYRWDVILERMKGFIDML